MTAEPVLVLHDAEAGRWYYRPPLSPRGDLFGDDLALAPAERRGWWYADSEAAQLEYRYETHELLGYKLKDGIPASEQFPAGLTPDDYRERVGDEEETAPVVALYERVTEPREGVSVVTADRVRLDGEPAPNDGLTWTAKLPYDLAHHTEFLHLFPGHLAGFRSALVARLNELPGVSAYDQTKFSVYAVVPDPRPPRSRRKADRRSVLTVEHKFSQPIPHRIEGATRAEAKVEWDRLLAEFVAEVDSVGAVVCESCNGQGYHRVPKRATAVA